jgi:hypothetical protein
VLFIIQSPYWFTIGRQGVFSLGRWSARFHAGFHESDATLVHLERFRIRLQDYHLLRSGFPARSPASSAFVSVSATPVRRPVWAMVRFRSPLLTESMSLYFPAGTEMFQFSAFASGTYAFSAG